MENAFNKYRVILILFIFSSFFSQGQDQKPSGTEAVFNFVVTSMSGSPRQGELVMLKSGKTKKIYQGTTGGDGKGTVTIPNEDHYTIYYKHITDTVKYKEFDVPGGDHRMTYTFTLKYDPPKVFTLKNVFFETGLATLKPESFPALDELVSAMKARPHLVIEIAGHTDNVGTDESNQKLSEDRALSVRGYLVKHGIDPKRVTARGYGETQPVASNDTPEGRQDNRRTEVRVISE